MVRARARDHLTEIAEAYEVELFETLDSDYRFRVILTPEHAKRLMHALTENVEKYEKAHGPIKNIEPASGPVIPMNFGGPTGQA
jgi:hypothetical protein